MTTPAVTSIWNQGRSAGMPVLFPRTSADPAALTQRATVPRVGTRGQPLQALPSMLGTNRAWYRGDLGLVPAAGHSAGWADAAGVAAQDLQSLAAPVTSPLIVASELPVNGRGALQFDGVGNLLRRAYTLPQPCEYYAVFRIDTLAAPGGGNFMFDGGSVTFGAYWAATNTPSAEMSAGTPLDAVTVMGNGVFALGHWVWNGAGGSFGVTGSAPDAAGQVGANAPTGIAIGGLNNQTRNMAVTFAEFLIFWPLLTAAETRALRRYFNYWYGFPVSP